MSSDSQKKPLPPNPAQEPPTKGHRGKVGKVADSTLAAAETVVYQVAVYTGDIPGASTDGDVWIWVDGTLGRSGWRFLDNAVDNFERGSTDYFYLNLPNLGVLSAAWIYFRPGTAWFLNTVVVNGTTFSYYNWLETEGFVRLT